MADYVFIQSMDALASYLGTLMAAQVLAVDLETTGLDPHIDRIRLLQLAVEGQPVVVVDGDACLSQGCAWLRALLETPAVKVFQNAKFDLQFLLSLDIRPCPLFDTMLAGRLLFMPGTPRRTDLATLAAHYLGETLDKQEQAGDWGGQLTRAQLAYAAEDAAILLRLRHAMIPQLKKAGLVHVATLEFACVRTVALMEWAGIHMDWPQWDALRERTEAALEIAREALYAFTGRPMTQMTLWGGEEALDIPLESNAYILALLKRNGIAVQATSKHALYPYRAHPLVEGLLAYRKASKSLSAFLWPITAMRHPSTGRLHPQYGQISAYSGRMSSWNPNIQQIPRDAAFRACFAAPEGRQLVIADYSQIELRVAAAISGDTRMLSAYRMGEDLHRLTASLMIGKPAAQISGRERQAAKAVNFGLIYGMGAAGLSQYAQMSYGVPMSQAQATVFRQRFFEAYPGIKAWHQAIMRHPPTEGRTLSGRRFPVSAKPSLPELSNAPVQGTAADIVKNALGLLLKSLPDGAFPVAVVHDEIVLECGMEQAQAVAVLLQSVMEAAAAQIIDNVPVVAEAKISATWAEKA